MWILLAKSPVFAKAALPKFLVLTTPLPSNIKDVFSELSATICAIIISLGLDDVPPNVTSPLNIKSPVAVSLALLLRYSEWLWLLAAKSLTAAKAAEPNVLFSTSVPFKTRAVVEVVFVSQVLI